MSSFRARGPHGDLVGSVTGEGWPVLVLHGGPGLSDYLGDLAAELSQGYEVATYTQRGLVPSSEDGPLDVAGHVADVVAVVDHLGWDGPVLGGHSWGGNLALHVLTRHPDRFVAGLVIDPLGAVGDGGMAEFSDELGRRVPPANRPRLDELNALEDRVGGLPVELALEQLSLVWPAYFPDSASAPPMPAIRMAERQLETWQSMMAELPELEARLRHCSVPTVFVHGAVSPMPLTASSETAALMCDATVEVVAGAAHFVWLDVPSSVRAALDRLSDRLSGRLV